jgi:hypothetical protein
MEMVRLPCGIIHSRAFADFLRDKHESENDEHFGEILSLDYIRVSEGEQAGSSWWQLSWISEFRAPLAHRFDIGGTEVFIHRQTRNGLKNRLLHYADGRVQVKR